MADCAYATMARPEILGDFYVLDTMFPLILRSKCITNLMFLGSFHCCGYIVNQSKYYINNDTVFLIFCIIRINFRIRNA